MRAKGRYGGQNWARDSREWVLSGRFAGRVTADTKDGTQHFLPITKASVEAHCRVAGVSVCFHDKVVQLNVILSRAGVAVVDLKQVVTLPRR